MKKYFPVLEFINIPNLITTIGLIFGIFACYFLIGGNLKLTMVCMSLATSMDLLDGFFAGKLNQETRFGQYVDTLVDFFICCILPVLIVYKFIGASPLIFAGIIFYCVCGLWRLAYFDVLLTEKRSYFTGLPVPSGMFFTMLAAWSVVKYGLPIWACMIVFFISGLLMTSFFKLEKYALWQKTLAGCGLIFFIVVLFS